MSESQGFQSREHEELDIMSMRQNAIDVMRANPDSPMDDVLPLIAETNQFSIGEARSYYKWIVRNGRAPGETLWVPEIPYLKPRTCSDAITLLRRCYNQPLTDTVNQLMRDLSNFDAIGRTASSPDLKAHNRWVSQKAYDLIKKCATFEQWNQSVINEHSTPVKVMLKWLIDHPLMTDIEIMQFFHESPVCSITYEEDNNLPKSSGTHPERYRAAGIVMIKLDQDPIEFWR